MKKLCEECLGEVKPTGETLYSSPLQYVYICEKCGLTHWLTKEEVNNPECDNALINPDGIDFFENNTSVNLWIHNNEITLSVNIYCESGNIILTKPQLRGLIEKASELYLRMK
jgi:hypothetical protein